MPPVKPIPDGYTSITPHLVVDNAVKAIEFYKAAFGAESLCAMPTPDGKKLLHAEIKIGNAVVMLCDRFEEFGSHSPTSLGGSPSSIHLYVEDVDKVWEQAIKAGAQVIMPLSDTFWGDRYGKLVDPSGHHWSLATHIKDMTPEEMKAGAEACFSAPAC